MSKRYLVVVEQTTSGYSAYSPDLPGCVATGGSQEEVEANIREAIEFHVEGLRLDEALHPLTILATGLYGKPLPNQNGAPVRIVVPWKYGFKSIKSIVRLEFTDKRPLSFWEEIQGAEYGFWANVNPEVPHPRWSQASERVLGLNEQVPTLLYNGYGEYVAELYKDIDPQQEALFM